MAYRIVWAPSALRDLRSLIRCIGRDDPPAAGRYGERILATVESLGEFPRLGKIVHEFRDDRLREIIVRPCRIVYELNDEEQILTILRIWHGARGDVVIQEEE